MMLCCQANLFPSQKWVYVGCSLFVALAAAAYPLLRNTALALMLENGSIVSNLYMLLAAVCLMKRAVGDHLTEIEIRNIRKEFITLLLVTALYFTMLVIYSSRPRSGYSDFWWWVVPPLPLSAAILCVFYWTLFRASVRRKRSSEQQKTLEIQRLQYEQHEYNSLCARGDHHHHRAGQSQSHRAVARARACVLRGSDRTHHLQQTKKAGVIPPPATTKRASSLIHTLDALFIVL